MRVRRLLVVVACVGSATVAVASCSSFTQADDEPDAAPVDPGVEGGPEPGHEAGSADAGGDANFVFDATPIDSSASDPPCPPHTAPASTPETWTRVPLYTPPSAEYPFAIASQGVGVAWIAQPFQSSVDAYDGKAGGNVYWLDRTGPSATPRLLAAGQPGATELVFDDDFVVWATKEASGCALYAQPWGVDCAKADCRLTLATLPAGRVAQIVRSAPGSFFVSMDSGDVYHVTRTPPGFGNLFTTSATPSLVADANNDLYFASEASKFIGYHASGTGSTMTFAPLPGGASHIASECTHIATARNGQNDAGMSTLDINTALIVSPTLFHVLSTTNEVAYDMAADEKYFYLAKPNGPGIWWFNAQPALGQTLVVNGNIWRLAVDDRGVYWGDHGKASTPPAGTGTIWMAVKP